MLAAVLLVAVTFTSAPAAPAVGAFAMVQGRQEAPQAREAREAMQKLSWLAGQWRGTATITQPGGQRTLIQTEDVRFKVFETSLLIEGTGRDQGPDGQRGGEIVFQALGIINYDAPSKSFKMRAITERGSVDPRIEVKEKEIFWGFEVPGGGEVKYHIRLSDQGHWLETGEFTRDGGQTWMKFIEMDLQRQDDPAP